MLPLKLRRNWLQFSFGAFLIDHGLREFLADIDANVDAPEIAAEAIVAFCIEDGKFNGIIVGLETVLQFLDETMEPPTDVKQRQLSLRDLKSILDAGGDESAIRQWIASYYK